MPTGRTVRGRRRWASRATLLAVASLVFSVPALADAAPGAIPLSESPGDLAASLNCSANVRTAHQEPVLLIPGTASTPQGSFGRTLIPDLQKNRTPFCQVTLPETNTGDVQRNAEYVVHAVRSMHAMSGRKVQMIGWSQGGGPMPRWALKYWPDIRPMVDNLIALDPDNAGTAVLDIFGCGIVNLFCTPAIWQQRPASNFIRTLNAGAMTYPNVNYTVIFVNLSNFIQPSMNGESQRLPAGPNVTNIGIQDFCGGLASSPPDHATVVDNPVSIAMISSVLARPGRPLDLRTVNRQTCGRIGSEMAKISGPLVQSYFTTFTQTIPRYGGVPAEPRLRCYAQPGPGCKR